MGLTYGKPPSHICISALTTVAIPNLSPIKKSKPIKPQAITPAYFLPTYLAYRKWIQMNILYWFVGHLYTTCRICDYWRHISAKRDWCIDLVTWQNFFDFSDYIVRHDNSSVHVQGSYRPYECSRLQTELIDNWSMRYRPASYRWVRMRNLNWR